MTQKPKPYRSESGRLAITKAKQALTNAKERKFRTAADLILRARVLAGEDRLAQAEVSRLEAEIEKLAEAE